MYASLILAISAVATASQQVVALLNLECFREGQHLIRKLVSTRSNSDDARVGPIQMPTTSRYHWQVPVMLQGQSLYLFLLGMGLFAYHEHGRASRLLPARACIQGSSTDK